MTERDFARESKIVVVMSSLKSSWGNLIKENAPKMMASKKFRLILDKIIGNHWPNFTKI